MFKQGLLSTDAISARDEFPLPFKVNIYGISNEIFIVGEDQVHFYPKWNAENKRMSSIFISLSKSSRGKAAK